MLNVIIAEKVDVALRYNHLFGDAKLPLPDGGGADFNVVAAV